MLIPTGNGYWTRSTYLTKIALWPTPAGLSKISASAKPVSSGITSVMEQAGWWGWHQYRPRGGPLPLELWEADVLTNVNQLQSFLTVVSILFVAAGIVTAIVLGKRMAAPSIQVKEGIEALADGDLTKSVQVDLEDEVGIVAAALNKTAASIRQAVKLVADTT